jgi:hypothetical protein
VHVRGQAVRVRESRNSSCTGAASSLRTGESKLLIYGGRRAGRARETTSSSCTVKTNSPCLGVNKQLQFVYGRDKQPVHGLGQAACTRERRAACVHERRTARVSERMCMFVRWHTSIRAQEHKGAKEYASTRAQKHKSVGGNGHRSTRAHEHQSTSCEHGSTGAQSASTGAQDHKQFFHLSYLFLNGRLRSRTRYFAWLLIHLLFLIVVGRRLSYILRTTPFQEHVKEIADICVRPKAILHVGYGVVSWFPRWCTGDWVRKKGRFWLSDRIVEGDLKHSFKTMADECEVVGFSYVGAGKTGLSASGLLQTGARPGSARPVPCRYRRISFVPREHISNIAERRSTPWSLVECQVKAIPNQSVFQLFVAGGVGGPMVHTLRDRV